MTTTCGPNGLALTIVIIGIVRASCTMALNSRTSEGSISGRTLTITEQRVKNIPETAARKIPRRTDEGLQCHFCSDFQRLNEGVYTYLSSYCDCHILVLHLCSRHPSPTLLTDELSGCVDCDGSIHRCHHQGLIIVDQRSQLFVFQLFNTRQNISSYLSKSSYGIKLMYAMPTPSFLNAEENKAKSSAK